MFSHRKEFAEKPIKKAEGAFKNFPRFASAQCTVLRDERKGRVSARVKWRKKREREDSDPNGIGLYPRPKVSETCKMKCFLFLSKRIKSRNQ